MNHRDLQQPHHTRSVGGFNALAGPNTSASTPTQSDNTMDTNNTHRLLQDITRYMDSCPFPYIKDVGCYEKLKKIGQGTFGEVFKARCKATGKMVALKKILMENEKEGFPITALREVKMLQQLRHQNITDLIEVCSSKSGAGSRTTFYLVFTFCEHDLAGLLSIKIKLSLVHIKTMMKHLLNGLCKLHRAKILHRDMKAANVLISKEGVLKLADFGLARPYTIVPPNQPKPSYTNRVVTLWYRPPELLLGDRQYGTKIDVWGAGCIMAEMWTRQPIMQGETEQKQLQLISMLCGSITPQVWPGLEKMPLFKSLSSGPDSPLVPNQKRRLGEKMGKLMRLDDTPTRTDEHALKLLEGLLAIDPSKRPSSEEAVDDIWFFKRPEPANDVADLMATIPNSQFEYTVGKGAHANRGRHQTAQPRQQNARPSANIPAGQFRDMIF